MSFSGWIIAGAIGLFARKVIKNEAEERERKEAENRRLEAEKRRNMFELARINDVNSKRKSTPCRFTDGLTYEEFSRIAHKIAKKIKRISSINVQGPVIYCTVESQTGYSNWDFEVDFNNWGHVTSVYWKWTENLDANIPEHFAQMVSGEIGQFYRDRNISLPNYSHYTNADGELGTINGLQSQYKPSFFECVFSKEKQIISEFDSKIVITYHTYS